VFVNRFFYPDESATSQLLSDLAFFLAERGWDVVVVTSRLSYQNSETRLPAADTVRGVLIKRVWTTGFGQAGRIGRIADYLSFYLAAFRALTATTTEGDFVVAETDPPLISVVAALACRLRRAKLVNWIQDLFPEIAHALGVRGISGPVYSRLVRFRNWSLQEATMNIAISEKMASYVRTQLRCGEVEIIHNWADGCGIRPVAPGENSVRKELNLDQRFVVGYSGNMGRAHEFDTIIAAADLLRDDRKVVFLFIGAGKHLPWLKALVQERKLGNVVFLPYQPRERLSESLSAADVHLISTRPEVEAWMFPSKLYGIAAAGRGAIFVGDPEGAVAHVLRCAECGVAVRMGEAEQLVDVIREFSRNPALVEAYGRNARDLLESKFEARKTLGAWHIMLERLALDARKKRS
jgi:glycosyltransferase involved in cell wall biosynthesis